MKHPLLIIFGYMIAIVVAAIAIRLEWMNHEAGGILPRTEYRNNDPAEGLVKWRAGIASEKFWRMSHLGEAEQDRELTPAEHTQMTDDIRRIAANSSLRSAVRTFGFLQYPLVAILVAISIAIMKKSDWRIAMPLCAIALTATILMFYRGYFTSLGD